MQDSNLELDVNLIDVTYKEWGKKSSIEQSEFSRKYI